MHSWDMKVETPVPFLELEDRNHHPGHEQASQCTFCGVAELSRWYPAEDVMVVRHWNSDSVDEPGGGHWTWYCPSHFEGWVVDGWKSSKFAPIHLLPDALRACEARSGLKGLCGDRGVEIIDGEWMCDRHAEAARTERRLRKLFGERTED